jgi:Fic-DOC domain mobile mystery protein B
MGLDIDHTDGQTPLDEDEKLGLKLPTIATRGELDEFEQQNIEEAILWVMGRRFKPEQVFTDQFIRNLHKRMYAEVWSWAGTFRKTNKNIGIDSWKIATELKYLLDDAKFWHQNNTYQADELAIRFKHRLVSIHCFPNGNGRHSRLMADIIIEKIYGQPVFTWGAVQYANSSEARTAYLQAIKAADHGDHDLLLAFARA